MKGDKTKGSKEKQPVKPKVDQPTVVVAEDKSKEMKSKSDELKKDEDKNVKQDKCKQ